MLWYKAWLETRWRFLIGLAVLIVFACGAVLDYPAIARLNASVSAIDAPGNLGRLIREAAETQRTYRGFIWFQWYRQNLVQTWTILAVLLGSGGLMGASSGSALFALSMPVSRTRLAGVRAATALMELLALAEKAEASAEALTAGPPHRHTPEECADFRLAVAEYEKAILAAALEKCRWNQRAAATALSLTYDQLRHAMRRHELQGS